jgi:DNA-binding transcriptional regulator GbsR (MarR family)
MEEQIKPLPEAMEKFILQWGDLGGQWGVNRSVSQIHAYLYLLDKPVTAEDIAKTLDMARSNVSNSIKELLSWNLIYRVPIKGDRRDHFLAEGDVWEIAMRISEGRKTRELDPALSTLKECIEEARSDKGVDDVALARLQAMHDFTQNINNWYDQVHKMSPGTRDKLMKMGAKVLSFIPGLK